MEIPPCEGDDLSVIVIPTNLKRDEFFVTLIGDAIMTSMSHSQAQLLWIVQTGANVHLSSNKSMTSN
jgi:hypothetical protein